MISWIFGLVIIVPSLAYGVIAMMASMMSDAPTAENAPLWPAGVGLIVGIVIIVGHHYGAW